MSQDGIEYQLAFLRDLSWINSVNAAPGNMIHLNLKEMGLNGPALVESITDCPPIEPDDGNGRMVVTGTMCHLAENILDLHVTGLNEPIGVTDTHPIWSEDRQAFVRAGQLRPEDHLRSEAGVISQVTGITPHRGPPELTSNLEVNGEHVYQVTTSGIVVHNDCLKYANNVLRRCPDGVVMRVDSVGVRTVTLPGFDNSTPNFYHDFHLENGTVRDSVFRRGISVDDYIKKPKELNPQVMDFMFTPRL